jgi:hypothetical protein
MNKNRLSLLIIVISFGISGAAHAGKWTALTHEPTFLNPPSLCAQYQNSNCAPAGNYSYGGILNVNLLTDGSLLVAAYAVDDAYAVSFVEYKLTPDLWGSYVNGTWTQVASLPDAQTPQNPLGWGPLDFASAVLPDGRVIYEGGEYSNDFQFALSSQGAIYDPVANAWQVVQPPNFQNLYPAVPPMLPGFNNFYTYPRYPAPQTSQLVDAIGDAPSVVLPDGTFMIASKLSRQQALLDPKTLTWKLTGTGKKDVNSEEGWTLLPNGKVLTVDTDLDYWFGLVPSYQPGHSELFDPKTGSWSSAGNTVGLLTAFPDGEIGPAVLMPDGIVFAAGAEGQNSLYDSNRNVWFAGPSFPTVEFKGQTVQLLASDTGAALLPNGLLLQSADTYGESPPTKFFEFDGHDLIPQPDIPDSAIDGGAFLMVLPSGQILEFDGNTDMEIYTASIGESRGGDGQHPWYAPSDIEVPGEVTPGGSYRLQGRLLNGVSQGAMEGDDLQMATNYPLVRITNQATHHVFYSRTHAFSSMAVANRLPATAWFKVPSDQEKGPSLLEVVANGVASEPVGIDVR